MSRMYFACQAMSYKTFLSLKTIPATYICLWGILRVGLQCCVSIVVEIALKVSLMQPQWKRELSMSSAKEASETLE